MTDSDDFEQKVRELYQTQLDRVDELSSRPIPDSCIQAVQCVRRSYSFCWLSLELLDQGYHETDPSEKSRVILEASQRAREAMAWSDLGRRDIEQWLEQTKPKRQGIVAVRVDPTPARERPAGYRPKFGLTDLLPEAMTTRALVRAQFHRAY